MPFVRYRSGLSKFCSSASAWIEKYTELFKSEIVISATNTFEIFLDARSWRPKSKRFDSTRLASRISKNT
jgi:hypothetical protein